MLNRNRDKQDKEIFIYEIRLLFPVVIFVLLLVAETAGIVGFMFMSISQEAPILFLPVLGFIGLIVLTITEFNLYSSSKCFITNHRLVGVVKSLFYRRTFSYQLDHVIGVQIKNIIGFKFIQLKASHGNGSSQVEKLLFVRQGNDVYYELVKMIESKKTDVDTILESLINNKE